MRIASIVLFMLLGTISAAQEKTDTLSASRISSTFGSLVVPQRISVRELEAVNGVSEAIRRFAGVQLRDYGGVGGLKTVNVRSLGSEHTGVFIDGIQIDNAQNMQVDLGRFGTDDIRSVSLFTGQKVSPLQSAKEYSSASALYLESAEPVFLGRKRDNRRIGVAGGSFGTISPSMTWEHLFKGGQSMRLTGEAISTDGRYRFHVKDFRQYPDGTIAGYDTTMTRMNGDLRSVRLDWRLFSGGKGDSSWNIHAYFYDSERGLPGPVYKRAGEYPLSEDRQNDMDAFLQGRIVRSFGKWSVSCKAKYSFSHLEYVDFPELRPEMPSAHFNYLNHSAYVSGAAMGRFGKAFKLNLAQDLQYDLLDADMVSFAMPRRFSSWSCASLMAGKGPFEAAVTALYLAVHDTFLSGGSRHGADRNVLMPSLVVRWKPSDRFSMNGFAKRSYRMPTFNDLYYTTVGSKTLDPEDAIQFDLGAEWLALSSKGQTLSFKVDAYHNRLKNKIIAVPTSNQFRWSMYNLGKVLVFGSDVVADYALSAGKTSAGKTSAGTTLRYTFQRALDRSLSGAEGSGAEGGQVPYIPVHSGSANVFGELSGWRADITFFATGERYTTSANLPAYRLDPWVTLDAALSKTLAFRSSSLRIKLCLNNLLDEQYEIVDNYPMPGFNFRLMAEYTF